MPASCASRTARKALALTTDVTPRYCEADPVRGRQAGGRRILAQPHRRRRRAARRHRQSQFRQSRAARRSWASSSAASQGIGEACRALDFPVVSGNVSLYNETNGRGILPTPDHRRRRPARRRGDASRRSRFKRRGRRDPPDRRRPAGWLGQSVYLREILRPRGGRAAAGRPRGREAQRRFRARS